VAAILKHAPKLKSFTLNPLRFSNLSDPDLLELKAAKSYLEGAGIKCEFVMGREGEPPGKVKDIYLP
jgi:hypothetical protein